MGALDVGAAARAARDMGTARWRQTSFSEPLRRDWIEVKSGVTDFAALRTRSQEVVEPAAWKALGERCLAR